MANNLRSIQEDYIHPNCIKFVKYTRIVLEENKADITFLNPKNERIARVKIDDTHNQIPVAPSGQASKRCDWLLEPPCGQGHFVELKSGSKWEDALQQLMETLESISLKADTSKPRKSYLFIVSKGAPLANSTIQVKSVSFRKRFNCVLRVVSSGKTFLFNTDKPGEILPNESANCSESICLRKALIVKKTK